MTKAGLVGCGTVPIRIEIHCREHRGKLVGAGSWLLARQCILKMRSTATIGSTARTPVTLPRSEPRWQLIAERDVFNLSRPEPPLQEANSRRSDLDLMRQLAAIFARVALSWARTVFDLAPQA